MGISYAQLRKWLSLEPVDIHPRNIFKADSLTGYSVIWLDSKKQNLTLAINETWSQIEVFAIPNERGKGHEKIVNIYNPTREIFVNNTLTLSIPHSMLDPTNKCFYEVHKLGTQEFFIPLKELTKTDNIIQVDIIDNDMIPAVLKLGSRITATLNVKYRNGDLVVLVDKNKNRHIGEIFEENALKIFNANG